MKRFICANCGIEIDDRRGVFCILDNFLQVAYFDDNRSNRFCSPECACEAMSGEWMDPDEVPLDEEEVFTEESFVSAIKQTDNG